MLRMKVITQHIINKLCDYDSVCSLHFSVNESFDIVFGVDSAFLEEQISKGTEGGGVPTGQFHKAPHIEIKLSFPMHGH